MPRPSQAGMAAEANPSVCTEPFRAARVDNPSPSMTLIQAVAVFQENTVEARAGNSSDVSSQAEVQAAAAVRRIGNTMVQDAEVQPAQLCQAAGAQLAHCLLS